jgi:hypothetical protein
MIRYYVAHDETIIEDSDEQGDLWIAVPKLPGPSGRVTLTTAVAHWDLTPDSARVLGAALLEAAGDSA